jgi:choice-of-anchor B domain-containing protein
MVFSHCLSLAVVLLLAIPNPAFSDTVFDPVIDTDPDPDSNDENAPHHGCILFLKEDHTPQAPLVGKDFEAITTTGYKVEDEAGPTAASCTNGSAGGYPCNNIDLMSVMSLNLLGETSSANDIWGWTHLDSGREFAIVGLKSGTAFVEITDPYNPVFVGKLPARNNLISSWRDIKTYQNYAYIVTEAQTGMQIFALEHLLDATASTIFDADAFYDGFTKAHNIFINEETATAYVVGSNTCSGGLHILDLAVDPLAPSFERCFADDGYTHDVQCVNYLGPDTAHQGKEICIASNEDTVTVFDKTNAKQLSRTDYSGARYTHQGWLTEDQKFFIFNDELDEPRLGGKTRTHVLDVTNLSIPVYVGYHEGRTNAIDHNNYVLKDQVYQANYRAGLNILKIVDPSTLSFEEEAFFDIYPTSDSNSFNGAWSNYPYFPSGNIIVSGIEGGLFVLRQTSLLTASPVMSPSALPSSSPVEDCSDQPQATFFVRWNGKNLTKKCSWLNNANRKRVACAMKNGSNGTPPARVVCRETCGTCPKGPSSQPTPSPSTSMAPSFEGACSQNGSSRFLFSANSKGKNKVWKTCNDLAGMAAPKVTKVCGRDYGDGREAKFMCRTTCGTCPSKCETRVEELEKLNAALRKSLDDLEVEMKEWV